MPSALADPDHPLNTPLRKTPFRKHRLLLLGFFRNFFRKVPAVLGVWQVWLSCQNFPSCLSLAHLKVFFLNGGLQKKTNAQEEL